MKIRNTCGGTTQPYMNHCSTNGRGKVTTWACYEVYPTKASERFGIKQIRTLRNPTSRIWFGMQVLTKWPDYSKQSKRPLVATLRGSAWAPQCEQKLPLISMHSSIGILGLGKRQSLDSADWSCNVLKFLVFLQCAGAGTYLYSNSSSISGDHWGLQLLC